MSSHDGHRERLKTQFTQHGLKVFNEINTLELLLFFAIPRKDTNEVAHNLLDQFGSLGAVFEASFEELKSVPGVGANSALLITFVHQLIKKLELSKIEDIKTIKSTKQAGAYFIPHFVNETNEVLLMLCLDSRRNIISCVEVSRGTTTTVDASIRRVAQIAMKQNAVSVILAHNHPGGVHVPSIEDDVITKKMFKSLRTLDILLEDHIIVAGDKYFSMADHNMVRF